MPTIVNPRTLKSGDSVTVVTDDDVVRGIFIRTNPVVNDYTEYTYATVLVLEDTYRAFDIEKAAFFTGLER
jgi:hypothetical protein